ncbi:hypothetical protein ACFWZT_09140 [Streptomyces alboflavus]|uniref:hypothetical protein n=1 Tax=Streptomyces alboflavus TaxID=67267 RepID=UPI0036AAB0E1
MAELRSTVRWVLLGTGLCATAIELGMLGAADVSGALTYAGRISGVVFLAAAILEVSALFALVNLRRPDAARYSAALVLVGVLSSLLANLVLFFLQLDGWGYTHYLWFWVLLLPWSCWALWRLHRVGIWRLIPHAKGFAVGVALTGFLAVANFTHTQIYQPYTSPAMLSNSVEFGTATVTNRGVSLPVRIRTRNTGSVGVYVLGSLYQVTGRKDSFVSSPRKTREWLQDLNSRQRELMRYTDVRKEGYELLAQGSFVGRSVPAHVLEPDAEMVTEKVVQFPPGASYDVLGATANITYLRKDRAKLVDNYSRSGRSSWTKKYGCCSDAAPPRWVANEGVPTFRFRSRIMHSSAVLENTRAPHYVTLWWVLNEPASESQFGPDLVSMIGPEDAQKREPTPAELRRMKDRYGLAHAPSGTVQKSLAELLKKNP